MNNKPYISNLYEILSELFLKLEKSLCEVTKCVVTYLSSIAKYNMNNLAIPEICLNTHTHTHTHTIYRYIKRVISFMSLLYLSVCSHRCTSMRLVSFHHP